MVRIVPQAALMWKKGITHLETWHDRKKQTVSVLISQSSGMVGRSFSMHGQNNSELCYSWDEEAFWEWLDFAMVFYYIRSF